MSGNPTFLELLGRQILKDDCHRYRVSYVDGKFVVTTHLLSNNYQDAKFCPERSIVEAIENALTGDKPLPMTKIPDFVMRLEKIIKSGHHLDLLFKRRFVASFSLANSESDKYSSSSLEKAIRMAVDFHKP